MQDQGKLLLDCITQYLDDKEAMLDAYIDAGSEQELFVASYIHGHFSVVAANVLAAINLPENNHVSLQQWQQQSQALLADSIDKAIENKELSKSDAADVLAMRRGLFAEEAK
jgi:hypothetical protein